MIQKTPTPKQEAHRKSIAWKPGQSGNPRGRKPLTKTIPDILRRIGSSELPEDIRQKMHKGEVARISESPSMLHALMNIVYMRALAGESWAVHFIAERTEGKVKDVLSLENGPERFEIEVVDATEVAPPPA